MSNKDFRVKNTATTLGSAVVASLLTSVGTIATGTASSADWTVLN